MEDLPVIQHDEIGELTEAFNTMKNRVRENFQAQEELWRLESLLRDAEFRALQSQVNQMAAQCANPDAAAAVRKLAEELRYSDPVSSPALEEAERDLSAAVADLQSAVADDDSEAVKQLCRKAAALLAERNRLCKLHKA